MTGKTEPRSCEVWQCKLLRMTALGMLAALLAAPRAGAETCLSSNEVEASTRAALEATARRYFDMTARGDAAGLRQHAIPSVAADFSGIEAAVQENQANFSGTQAAVRPPFLLKAEGDAPLQRAEFLCGVFGARGQTASSAVFVIPNLPSGDYAVVILDVTTAKGPWTISMVLEQFGSDWKLGGFYAKSALAAGHDAAWFADRAREFKAKSQLRNAWFYFLQARDLASPLPFMSTMQTDKLYDESQGVQPSDLPSTETPMEIVAQVKVPPVAGQQPPSAKDHPVAPATTPKTFKMTSMFPVAFGNDLDLVVKYGSADVSSTAATYADNVGVIHALVAKYPELRDGFAGIVARAVEPSGRDYGTLLAMKDVK